MTNTELETNTILKEIDKHVGVAGKLGRQKIYILENGNVAYVRYANISISTRKQYMNYYFQISKDKYEEYKEKFRLVLICGSAGKTLIIPYKDIESLFKNVSLNNHYWCIYISSLLKLGEIDLSQYLNRWEFLNGYEKIDNENNKIDNEKANKIYMSDKIRESDLRTKIYEIISGLSKKNKKCNHIYLCNDLYAQQFGKFEIYDSLKFLEDKDAIYKIVYVNWYINIIYRVDGIPETDKLLLDIFNTIKKFSIKSDWKYGLKKSDLYDILLGMGYTEENIYNGLKYLEEKKIIYKKSFIYWFTHDYAGEPVKTDIIDDKEIYMPDKIEDVEIDEEDIKNIKIEDEIKIEDIKNIKIDVEDIKNIKIEDEIKIEDINIDNEYSDIFPKLDYLRKKWKELKYNKDKLEVQKQKEIELQMELDRKKEESIKRRKELDEKISQIVKEKDSLENLFDPIRTRYDLESTVVIEKKVK